MSTATKTVPVRVPDDMAREIQTVARLKRITPAQLMEEVWAQYVAAHVDEFLGQLNELAAKLEALR